MAGGTVGGGGAVGGPFQTAPHGVQHGSGAAAQAVPLTQEVAPGGMVGGGGPSVEQLRAFWEVMSAMMGGGNGGGGGGGKGLSKGSFNGRASALDERYFRHIDTFKGSAEGLRTFFSRT